jgi:hypothetical protein
MICQITVAYLNPKDKAENLKSLIASCEAFSSVSDGPISIEDFSSTVLDLIAFLTERAAGSRKDAAIYRISMPLKGALSNCLTEANAAIDSGVKAVLAGGAFYTDVRVYGHPESEAKKPLLKIVK